MSLLTICDFTVLANYEAIEPMCIDWYNIGAMHRNNRVQFVDQLVILHSINKGSQLASSVHQFTQHNTPNVYRPSRLDRASAQAVCPFYCSPLAFMFGSYISPCGASVLLYYISPYILIAIFVAIGRDPLAQCYRAFVHVRAYSVFGRLRLNHVLPISS